MDQLLIDTERKSGNNESVLKEYYARYLLNVRGLKQRSVDHYFDALNNISRRLKAMNLVENSIYEIADLERLSMVKEILYADPDFKELNNRGNRMYSVGLNNYYRFASGEGFEIAKEKIVVLDIPVSPAEAVVVSQEVWKRSGILRTQAIELAGYKCEMDIAHETFLAESNHKPYMEGHHAVPMRLQGTFHNSLDVYANIICLCPLCHRKIHYGMQDERRRMMCQIYEKRADRLVNSGILLSKNEFIEIAM